MFEVNISDLCNWESWQHLNFPTLNSVCKVVSEVQIQKKMKEVD